MSGGKGEFAGEGAANSGYGGRGVAEERDGYEEGRARGPGPERDAELPMGEAEMEAVQLADLHHKTEAHFSFCITVIRLGETVKNLGSLGACAWSRRDISP